ncbi:hypothetical protein AVEN_142521-1 [Araneus ventricosus]|uniref:Uncharacterized protein n=1 Tax=Araneus ventricosus TaxID=182803 RepID=A0A4Y2CFN0_ARAVE|nr:hypothetical protein AVEN_142521-1 [Araneus ventricosus]
MWWRISPSRICYSLVNRIYFGREEFARGCRRKSTSLKKSKNRYSRIQRHTKRSKALVDITSPYTHYSCRSICFITTPTNQLLNSGIGSEMLKQEEHPETSQVLLPKR